MATSLHASCTIGGIWTGTFHLVRNCSACHRDASLMVHDDPHPLIGIWGTKMFNCTLEFGGCFSTGRYARLPNPLSKKWQTLRRSEEGGRSSFPIATTKLVPRASLANRLLLRLFSSPPTWVKKSLSSALASPCAAKTRSRYIPTR
jgi:hypothetical protein